MNKQNCAIYVRKSTEKGLEQEFNSLQNQEDACRNYILSQAFNGWEYYRTFEDGGISGGTMKRPALLEMMEEIKAGKIQVVAVYKVDRLSRSIMDFHNMMQEFDKYNCNFVSITQAFDTSTSMGKLTLNMLLSFAQFEREVASERIRDKIAASKAKGFWTGGFPPLGYDVDDKKLVVNEKESEQVQFIFEKYLEVGNVRNLEQILEARGISAKQWADRNGRVIGGNRLTKTMIARILRARVYVGQIECMKQGTWFPGRHQGIIDPALFRKVQETLDGNQQNHCRTYNRKGYLLTDKLFDEGGVKLKNLKGSKNQVKKYRYYGRKGKYLPAGDLEEIAVSVIRDLLDSPLEEVLDKPRAIEFKMINFNALDIEHRDRLIRAMIDRVVLHSSGVTFFINSGDPSYLRPFQDMSHINRNSRPFEGELHTSYGCEYLIARRTICINSGSASITHPDGRKKIITVTENNDSLVRALSLGWRYGRMVIEGLSIRQVADREHRASRTVYRYFSLNYLSPVIVDAIMERQNPGNISLQTLFDISSKFADFKEQEKAFFTDANR